MRILGDWNWWPGGRKKSVFRAKGEESRRATRAIARAVVAAGVFALTGFVTASILGLGLALIVLVNAALICALLLPIVMRTYGGRERSSSSGESVFEFQSKTDAPLEDGQRTTENGRRQADEQRSEEDAQNAVDHEAERQEAAGNGHPRENGVRREVHHASDPERQSLRPRPGRAHLDGFRRLERELRNAAESTDGERIGPESDGDNGHPGRAYREEQGHKPGGPTGR
ncbi:MAG: hypothetical protein LC781_11950 [Actinobacteria bacterium]|nr:hypothetical protein [Actinomycetota bacterium]